MMPIGGAHAAGTSPTNDEEKGTAAYRSGQFPQAAQAFEQSIGRAPSSDAQRLAVQEDAYYNLGNALYRSGQMTEKSDPKTTIEKWTEAVRAYETALELRADDADSKYNRDLVKRKIDALRRPPPPPQNQGSGKGQTPPPPQNQGSGKRPTAARPRLEPSSARQPPAERQSPAGRRPRQSAAAERRHPTSGGAARRISATGPAAARPDEPRGRARAPRLREKRREASPGRARTRARPRMGRRKSRTRTGDMDTNPVLRGRRPAALLAGWVVASAFAAPTAFAAAPVIDETIAPAQISIGESAELRIKSSGSDLQSPRLPVVPGLEFHVVATIAGGGVHPRGDARDDHAGGARDSGNRGNVPHSRDRAQVPAPDAAGHSGRTSAAPR